MPNHVTNYVSLYGDDSDILRLMETERKLYGKNNWYDWSIANWGAKWNSYGYDETTDYSPRKTSYKKSIPKMKKSQDNF